MPEIYQCILIPIDLDDDSSWQKALPTAVRLAEIYDASLHVMTVAPAIEGALGMPEGGRVLSQRLARNAEGGLEALVLEHVPKNLRVKIIVAQGSIYREILRVAGEVQADLIVMASHHPKGADFLLGINAAQVVRHSRRSVMVVRNPPPVSAWAVLP